MKRSVALSNVVFITIRAVDFLDDVWFVFNSVNTKGQDNKIGWLTDIDC